MEKVIDRRQGNIIRKIIRVNILEGDCFRFEDNFLSGDEIVFSFGEDLVKAIIKYSRAEVSVEMSSPIKCFCRRHLSNFSRNIPFARKNGNDKFILTQKGIETAKDILIGLYSDWKVLESWKDQIRTKLQILSDNAVELERNEKLRVQERTKHLNDLNNQGKDLKLSFERGEIDNTEFILKRQILHDRMSKTLRETQFRDPFETLFEEELATCLYVFDKKALIKSFV